MDHIASEGNSVQWSFSAYALCARHNDRFWGYECEPKIDSKPSSIYQIARVMIKNVLWLVIATDEIYVFRTCFICNNDIWGRYKTLKLGSSVWKSAFSGTCCASLNFRNPGLVLRPVSANICLRISCLIPGSLQFASLQGSCLFASRGEGEGMPSEHQPQGGARTDLSSWEPFWAWGFNRAWPSSTLVARGPESN